MREGVKREELEVEKFDGVRTKEKISEWMRMEGEGKG